MQRLSKFILSILMIFTIIAVSTPEIVNATNNYSMLCSGQYELSTANADGSFTKKACYGDFYAARDAMSGVNDVVRHDSSLSPMKIVAMKQGVGYTYPARSDELTLTFTQYTTTGGKTTSSTVYREFIYYSTGEYSGNGNGTIYSNLNGFKGYTSLKNVDLIPQIFIDNNIEVSLGSGYNAIAKRSYYTAKQNGNYTDLVFTWYSGKPATGTNTMVSYSHNIGQAPDWMIIGETYYSDNGYDFYTTTAFTDKVETYYPYYVYLPFRSTTDIPAFIFDNYLINKIDGNESVMKDKGQVFIDNQNEYGVNALMTFALGALESGFGTSNISITKNNLFGWNAVDTSPSQSANYYETVDLCIRDHMAINLRGYLDAFDSRYFGSHIGNKGSGFNVKYATDTYWGYKIAAIAYEIDKLSNNYNGDLTDYNKYDLYLASDLSTGSKLYKTESKEIKLYSLDYGGIYQEANIQIALDVNSSSIKVQSTNIVDSSINVVKHKTDSTLTSITSYDWNRSVGYMFPSQLSKINNIGEDNTGSEVTGEFVMELYDFKLTNNIISLSGTAYQPGIYLDNVTSLKHYLYITDSAGKEIKSIELTQTNSGLEHYAASNFIDFNLDISGLATDKSYNLAIKTVSDKYTKIVNITSVTNTSYTVGSNGFTLASTTIKTVLTIEANTPEVTATPTPITTATPNTSDIEVEYYTWLENYSLSDIGVLSMDGYAFVTGKDNGEGKVSHKLKVIKLIDNSLFETVDLNTTTGDKDISSWFAGDYDYSYAFYNGNIDISNYNYSEYKFTLVTTIEGIDYEQDLHVRYNDNDTEPKLINEKYYTLNKEYFYMYRLELTVDKVNFAIDKTKLPSYKESYVNVFGITYDENSSILRLTGSAFVWLADFDVSKNPRYIMYLLNTESGEVFIDESDALSELSGYSSVDLTSDINRIFDTDYNYKNILYDFEFDSNNLTNGKYVAIIKIVTDEVIDYVDFKNMSNIEQLEYQSLDLNIVSRRNISNKYKIEISIEK